MHEARDHEGRWAGEARGLEVTGGSCGLTLEAFTPEGGYRQGEPEFELSFEGAPPRVERHGPNTRVAFGWSPLPFWPSTRRCVVRLSTRVPWSIEIRGGTARTRLDLRSLDLRRLELRSGSSGVTVALPRPSGRVPLIFRGGVHDLRVERPRGTALGVELRGGAVSLELDSLRLGSLGGPLRWQSEGGEGAADRFEVELRGGAAGASFVAAGEAER